MWVVLVTIFGLIPVTNLAEDIKVLNIEEAEVYPAATGHINEMITLIEVLVEKGYAYQADDNCVYFSIAKFPEYGKLSQRRSEDQVAGSRDT